ncbi:MAG: L,D-transpeptidase [Sphingomonadales bacterium]
MKNAFPLSLLVPFAVHAAPSAAPVPKIDVATLHVQAILDKLGFGPGVLDGKGGASLVNALKGFQQAHGLRVTGKTDTATLAALSPYRAWEPTKKLQITETSLRGPFTVPFPTDPIEQAKLPALNYRNAVEALAERFHTTPATLVALNPGGKLVAGAWLVFPNALPFSRAYSQADPVWAATLNHLNVNADQPQAKRIVVDKSDGVLRVYDAADKLVAQFTATMGSSRDPLPIGKWTVKGADYNPKWTYNPNILKRADKSDPKVDVPAGPNSPVGVVWLDLSKPHYGIHGTNEPEKIGRAESNGCIRLTNWDAARLALMIKPGTPAVFQP